MIWTPMSKNSKSFCGRPSRSFLCIRLAITDCPGHLEGQTSPEASIRLISTIFVCYSTPFFGDPNCDVKNAKNFFGRPVITLAMYHVVSHGQSGPFSRSNEPRSAHTANLNDFYVLQHTFFWWSKFQRKKCKTNLFTSFKTLSMLLFGPHDQSDAYSRSNVP